jgi:hypothetical protein
MLILIGTQQSLTEQLATALHRAGHEIDQLSAREVANERSYLFMYGMQTKPRGVVLVEDLEPSTPPDPVSDKLLRHTISSTSAAGIGPLIVITARTEDDPQLRLLRSDGVVYQVLRVDGAVSEPPSSTKNSRSLKPSVSVKTVCDAVLEALAPGAGLGVFRVLKAEPEPDPETPQRAETRRAFSGKTRVFGLAAALLAALGVGAIASANRAAPQHPTPRVSAKPATAKKQNAPAPQGTNETRPTER